jgi:hypothetical protein
MTPEPTHADTTATGAVVAATGPSVKPSQLAITKMLAEAEVARRHALRPWLVSLLLPVLLGAALLGFSSYAVYTRLQRIKELDGRITVNQAKIEEQQKELAALDAQLAGAKDLASAALSKLPTTEAKEVIAAAAESNPNAATTPRVFIQIYDEEQRAKAREVAQALKSSGLIVPGIERRPEKVDGNQVKYFRREDKDAANKVASIFAGQGFADAKAVFVGGIKAPPGQIEIWFAPAIAKPNPTPTPTLLPRPTPVPPLASRYTEEQVRAVVVQMFEDGTGKEVNPNVRLKELGISVDKCVGLTWHFEDLFRVKPNEASLRRLCVGNPTASDIAHYLYVEGAK